MGSSRRRLWRAALYLAAAVSANAASAQDLAAFATGEMEDLVVHETPRPIPDAEVLTPDGAAAALPTGRPVVLNFWATWCVPCRVEMPHLAALQEAMGEEIEVVLVATGRNDPEAALEFLAEVGADGLTDLRDPEGSVGRGVAVVGLPTTLVLDPQGREVARLQGIAEWHGEEAQALLRALAEG
jgi:thiol-disulfide isomerase/thioredoxin